MWKKATEIQFFKIFTILTIYLTVTKTDAILYPSNKSERLLFTTIVKVNRTGNVTIGNYYPLNRPIRHEKHRTQNTDDLQQNKQNNNVRKIKIIDAEDGDELLAISEKEFSRSHLNNTDGLENSTNNKKHIALSGFNGKLDLAFVESINPFWLSFNPPPINAHYALGIAHSFIMVIGLAGNALVLFMFIRCKSLRTPANTLVINLAVSDFLMLAKAPVVIYNSFKFGPALGDIACRIYGFLGGLTGTASIMTLTAISIDRYHVVVYPLDPLRSTTRLRSRLMVLFVWIYSLIFSIVPALNIGFSKYVPEGYLTSCSFDYLDKTVKARIFMFLFFIFAWMVPFLTISYCYFYILKVVISANSIQSSKDKNKTEIKLAAIVMGVIGLWFTAWTPYSIVALLGISGNEDKLTPIISMIPAVFCKSAACIDPYVYAITHPRFRMEFGRLFLGRDRFTRYQTSCSRASTVGGGTLKSVRRRTKVRDSTTAEDGRKKGGKVEEIKMERCREDISTVSQSIEYSELDIDNRESSMEHH